jgi:N-acetylmuramic acid 6-phosphate etherase
LDAFMSSTPDPPAPLPPDRSHIATEQRHPRSMTLDVKDARGIVDLMLEDHAAVMQALRTASHALATFIEGLVERMEQGGRLIYLGAGTSGRLGVLDASECPPTFHSDPNQVIGIIAGGDPALRRSSEGREDEPDGAKEALDALHLGELDTVLGIAAGGTTPYVLGGLQLANKSHATTALLTCAAQVSHPDACDHLIVLRTGPEVLTGSTRLKAGTATKIALNIITTAAFVRMGKAYTNLMVDVRATNHKLTDRAIRIMQQVCPGLSREDAAEAVRTAEGDLKAAIVMHHTDLDLFHAKQRLREHHGRLREALGS